MLTPQYGLDYLVNPINQDGFNIMDSKAIVMGDLLAFSDTKRPLGRMYANSAHTPLNCIQTSLSE